MILEDFFRRPSAIARYRLPPLGPLMDGFCGWLHAQGFTRDVTRRRIWQASHFKPVSLSMGNPGLPEHPRIAYRAIH